MSWREKALNKLPNLKVGAFQWVNGNILINDLDSDDVRDAISCVGFKVPVQIYSFNWLTNQLRDFVNFKIYDSFIWPGRGGEKVRKSLGFLDKGIQVPTKRIGYNNPIVEIEPFRAPAVEKIAVIDDVVSSGVTALGVFRQGNLKQADLVTPIMQYPEDKKLLCYEQIFTFFLVRGPKGKVPVNSISTFLTDLVILKSYADRFCLNPVDLTIAIDLIKDEEVFNGT